MRFTVSYYSSMALLLFGMVAALPAMASISFNKAEQDYLTQKGSITYCIDPNWMPYEAITGDGRHTGMSADYFRLFTEHSGIAFTLHPTRTWKETLLSAQNRQCDLISMARETKERKNYLKFTKPYVNFPYVIATTVDKQYMNDIGSNLDKVFGVVGGYAVNGYLSRRYPDIKIIELKDFDDGIERLRKGEIYGYIDSLITLGFYIQQKGLLDIKVGGETNYSSSLSVASRNDEPLLAPIMQKVLDSISKEQARHIRNVWVSLNYERAREQERRTVTLSPDEQRYVAAHPSATMCVDPDWMPYEAIQDGKHTGIGGNILPLIAERAGIRIDLVQTKSWSDTLEHFRNKECDILSMLNKTPERDEYMDYTRPYYKGHIVFVAKNEYPYIADPSQILGKTVAVAKGYSIAEFLKRDYQNLTVLEVDNYDQAFEMVTTGEADLTADYLISSGDRIQRLGLYGLKIAGNTAYKNELRIGVQKDMHILRTILDKAVTTLESHEINAIINQWRTVRYEQEFDYTLLWQILGVSALIILSGGFWTWRLSIANKQTRLALDALHEAKQDLEKAAITDSLTGIFNRSKIDQLLEQELARATRYGSVFGLILLDVDFFKSVNDSHGHAVGDAVLIEMADLLQKSSRQTDYVGRWGGEEFVVICCGCTLAETKVIANKLRQTIADHDFSTVGNKTASFGVTAWREEDTAERLLLRADEALYASKDKGRNRVTVNA